MEIKEVKGTVLKVSTPENWITNQANEIFSKELWLSKIDSPENYIEITDEEKQAIEAEQ